MTRTSAAFHMLACTLLLLAAGGCSHSRGPAAANDGSPSRNLLPKSEKATMQRFIDAETIEVLLQSKVQRVNLLYVMTEPQNSELGRHALAQARKQLLKGTKIELEFEDEKRNAQGYLKAYVFARSAIKKTEGASQEMRYNFNTWLVAHGISPYCTKDGESRLYHKKLQSAEEYARKNALGIWATDKSTNKYLVLKVMWDLKGLDLKKDTGKKP